ncbi:unnamed protein product [Rotaria magnacalcarata]|uniref:SWIM-type domain-containing protein n=1 Tax=Rotaria magnacalcarata TaxID=392030 RepID=A0A816YJN0_9BILA|nr:unnamed protein product [Rotaria magnacalcarata]
MPRYERLKCVACDGYVDLNRKQLVGVGLWKLFLSARSLKQVNSDDTGCTDCRMKYLNWLKKVGGDFDHYAEHSGSSVHNTGYIDKQMDTDVGIIEQRVEINAQTEIKSNTETIMIPIERCTKSHRECIVCGLRDGSLKVLSKDQRTLVFVKRGILVPAGSRCCSNHLYNQHLDFDSISQIRADQMERFICDANRLQEILNDFRLILVNQKSFDFDNPYSLNDQDYYNVTGLHRDQFDQVVKSIKSMHNSHNRSIRVAVAIFCAKMRLGVSNDVLATMFHMCDKRVISKIIHQTTNALIKDFAPAYIGFAHISRDSVLKSHQTELASALFTDDNQQVVVVMDGTYLFIQKSMYNELQRRTYSTHKHRHLIKPMIVTTTNGYILSVLGPFFGDYRNKDAKIIQHCLLNNEQDILKWLKDDDIIILDRGFRDVVPTMKMLGFQTVMPSFLNGRPQLTTEEANESRLVTANRWVIESSTYQIRMAKSYIQDHLTQSILNDDAMEFLVELCTTREDLVRVRFQSRHSNRKHHAATVQFHIMNEDPIRGYYCTCTSGAREVGCCVHVAAVLWHLGVQRGNIDQNVHPLSAIKLMEAVHDSTQYSRLHDESDDDDDDDVRYTINQDYIDNSDDLHNATENSDTDSDNF